MLLLKFDFDKFRILGSEAMRVEIVCLLFYFLFVVETGNILKVNFDGAWIPSSCTGGIGVVIRDFNGDWCGGLSSPLICDSALVAEAAAGPFAINFAKERGMGKIILEYD